MEHSAHFLTKTSAEPWQHYLQPLPLVKPLLSPVASHSTPVPTHLDWAKDAVLMPAPPRMYCSDPNLGSSCLYVLYLDSAGPYKTSTLLISTVAKTLAYTIIAHSQYTLFILVALCDPIGPRLHYTFLSIQTRIPAHVHSYSCLCQKSFPTIISTLHRAT